MTPSTRNSILGAVACVLAAGALFAQEDEDIGWPREIERPEAGIVIYQPQVDTFIGDDLAARAAVSVTLTGKSTPVFGAVWIQARVDTDRDNRTVTILEIQVPQVRFPDATEAQEQQLAGILVEELSGRALTFSLDRLLTSLDVAEHERQRADDFNNDPPNIEIADYPAILVTIDGEPRLRDIEAHPGLQNVVNSAFMIIRSSSSYYLYAGSRQWYAATGVMGPWQFTQNVPSEVQALAPVEEENEARKRAKAAMQEAGEEILQPDPGPPSPPAILVATEPTELIVIDGAPDYKPVGRGLLYVSNTESDVLMEIATQRHFVLLSGRWFAGQGLQGPWSFIAADELPAGFATIPIDSDVGHVRVWVAGTEEAEEAVLDASIPQTAAVPRTATTEVAYDGSPRFETIEGTSLQWATNTAEQVIKDGNRYYCVKDGVWYAAGSASGPWTVATEVPAEVRDIPPSSPVYNTKYVYIYDTTPDVVYVGYLPGYTHSYVAHGVIVYGTGWYYRPWWGAMYYPRVPTYGFHVRWNPWWGWSMGFSWSSGRFTFGIGFGGFGGWHHAGWWGPVGYRPYYRGYARGWHHGYRAGARAGYAAGRLDSRYRAQNLYRRNNVARVSGPATRPATLAARPVPNRANNVYADRSGNVHQRSQSGQWQQRAGTTRSSGRATTQSLNRQYQSRRNGAARTQSYRGSGGVRRGGGGRRR